MLVYGTPCMWVCTCVCVSFTIGSLVHSMNELKILAILYIIIFSWTLAYYVLVSGCIIYSNLTSPVLQKCHTWTHKLGLAIITPFPSATVRSLPVPAGTRWVQAGLPRGFPESSQRALTHFTTLSSSFALSCLVSLPLFLWRKTSFHPTFLWFCIVLN